MTESPPRLNEVERLLMAADAIWPLLAQEIGKTIAQHVETLITQDNPEVRGRIKALRDLLNLPETLHQERADILAAELSDDPDSAPQQHGLAH